MTTLSQKRIVFIRHGCTYMNEYLSGSNFGCRNFSDVFPNKPYYNDKYPDSKLSSRGIQQAKGLASRLKDLKAKRDPGRSKLSPDNVNFLDELELVVTSPLTRAIQTLKIGLYPSLPEKKVPVIALPLASERVYLISDIGLPKQELEQKYGDWIDFDVGFSKGQDDTWWYTPPKDYQEWRPSGQGQRYACPGEPDEAFEDRMLALYKFLESRKESTIAVVCHWGVIDWFLAESFRNCELRVVKFSDIQPVSIQQARLPKQAKL